MISVQDRDYLKIKEARQREIEKKRLKEKEEMQKWQQNQKKYFRIVTKPRVLLDLDDNTQVARAPLRITTERKKHRKSTDIPFSQEILAAQEKKEKLKQYAL